jgi:hypothetical protein
MFPPLPSIPDNSYKFLLYLGLLLFGYAFIQGIESNKIYNYQTSLLQNTIDSMTIKNFFQTNERKKLMEKANNLSLIYGVQNPIIDNDSFIVFNQTIVGDINSKMVSDSLQLIWDYYKSEEFQIDLLNEKIRMNERNLKSELNQYEEVNYFYFTLAFLGIIITYLGYNGMEKLQKLNEKLIEVEIDSKVRKYRHCQSCGKNYSAVRVNGKDKNGNYNPAFCIDCYDDGEFKEPVLTLKEFKLRTETILKQQKGYLLKRRLKIKFEKLERWLTNEYI